MRFRLLVTNASTASYNSACALQDAMGHAQGKANELGSKAKGKAEELKH